MNTIILNQVTRTTTEKESDSNFHIILTCKHFKNGSSFFYHAQSLSRQQIFGGIRSQTYGFLDHKALTLPSGYQSNQAFINILKKKERKIAVLQCISEGARHIKTGYILNRKCYKQTIKLKMYKEKS
ncbi:hypothetical protein AVEN_72170-1 [Araneus ventricosus]|uniref:Uncharacterized protein n=1 Tax=Araneus ventricosus TaxID=182803 RepID=A0A4Y2WZ04_ARAVE|nr:hypothetical protein AVEN_72170-1 [Araneus ventricosus]